NASEEFNFNRSDLQDFKISDKSFSKSMDLYNVYVQQNYQNIPVFNAIGSFAIKQNRVVNFNHSFIPNLDQKIHTSSSTLSARNAISAAIENLNLNINLSGIQLLETISSHEFIFKAQDLSGEVIPVKLMYVPDQDRKYRLAWDLSILTSEESHWWSLSIDARTGEVLRQNDWMLSCNFEENPSHQHHKAGKSQFNNSSTLSLISDGSSYRAYPLGIESPNHGNRVLLNQPADPTASPFGWHDTDGVAGPEFTITRGNNVLASEDRDADNIPGYSPDGGTNLNFDFPIDNNLPPAFNEDAAITNLFVWNNYTHDVWFNHGFDEDAGNFQQTNYSGQGAGNDFVVADAQDGAGLNNANFGTPPEGFNPRMQMFLWSPPGPPSDPLSINSPSDIAGDYSGIEASFGPGLTPTPITSDLVLISDDDSSTSTDPHDACDPLTNASSLNGKIVVINRGDCFFVDKIQAAQNNGALAVIMINNVFGDPIAMGGDGSNITIPSIMISLTDGSAILSKLQNGQTINATLVNNGPFEVDGDFDNVIIAHEYGHGISNRLTGGPQQANCLFNDEQMGEGWSDWIGLMMTIQPNDTAGLPRGIGTFAISQPTTGNGIRPARYTTDTSINPATYGLSNNPNISQPHGVGFVWATMLWDLTWELIDEYGFDPDLMNGNGGNNLAMQLIIDGMKLQSCNPGFIDGRDAILQADMLANNGANQCFIWKVFADRGLGFSANQGSAFDRNDQTEAFDLPPNITLPCENLAVQSFNENTLKLYPNPAEDILTIESLGGSIGRANLKIFDMNGRLIINKPLDFNQVQNLNVSSLNSGVYLIKIENTSVDISKKLIIN
ncbi:MAG: T9SS type A sorting domain-containing protein, partial [Bacteroidetes bacterium]|nr:T9SS type A sorting domain-containing protein [Bacteroidota bacterium]